MESKLEGVITNSLREGNTIEAHPAGFYELRLPIQSASLRMWLPENLSKQKSLMYRTPFGESYRVVVGKLMQEEYAFSRCPLVGDFRLLELLQNGDGLNVRQTGVVGFTRKRTATFHEEGDFGDTAPNLGWDNAPMFRRMTNYVGEFAAAVVRTFSHSDATTTVFPQKDYGVLEPRWEDSRAERNMDLKNSRKVIQKLVDSLKLQAHRSGGSWTFDRRQSYFDKGRQNIYDGREGILPLIFSHEEMEERDKKMLTFFGLNLPTLAKM